MVTSFPTETMNVSVDLINPSDSRVNWTSASWSPSGHPAVSAANSLSTRVFSAGVPQDVLSSATSLPFVLRICDATVQPTKYPSSYSSAGSSRYHSNVSPRLCEMVAATARPLYRLVFPREGNHRDSSAQVRSRALQATRRRQDQRSDVCWSLGGLPECPGPGLFRHPGSGALGYTSLPSTSSNGIQVSADSNSGVVGSSCS